MNLESRELTAADKQRWRSLTVHEPTTDEGWLELADLVLERVGLRQVVQLGDPRKWRQALSEFSQSPLPPLNLPLSVWEGYLAHPFSSVRFHFTNGEIQPVQDWSNVYYCWHSRTLALDLNEGVVVKSAADLAAVEGTEPSAVQCNTTERIRWFKRAEPFVPIAIRTTDGKAFLVDQSNRIQLDDSASVLAIIPASGSGLELITVREIASVRQISEQSGLLHRLSEALKQNPFRPFQVRFCNGNRWTINRPEAMLVTKQRLFLGQGQSGPTGYESTCQAGTEWIESIDPLPADSQEKSTAAASQAG